MKNEKQVNEFDSVMTKPGMTQRDYLFLLRRQNSLDAIQRIVERNEDRLSKDQIGLLYGAADHRRVEIMMGKLYDRIPPTLWRILL